MNNKDFNSLEKAYFQILKEEDSLRSLYEPSARERAESVYGEEPPTPEQYEDEEMEISSHFSNFDQIVKDLKEGIDSYMNLKGGNEASNKQKMEEVIEATLDLIRRELFKK